MAKTTSIALQERDYLILSEIAESPACTRKHIAISHFEGRYEAAKKRLQSLARYGLLENNDKTASGRKILRITDEGFNVLRSHGCDCPRESIGRSSPRMHKHEMTLADCRVAFRTALEKEYGADLEFYNPNEVAFAVTCCKHRTFETVRPDGFVTVRDCSSDIPRHFFFIEIDRSTETQAHLIHLACQYRAYRQSGDFASKFGDPFKPKRTAFRVLLIVKSRERLISTGLNLRDHARIRTLFWLTTVSEFMKRPSGPIWHCPRDFEGSVDILGPRPLFNLHNDERAHQQVKLT